MLVWLNLRNSVEAYFYVIRRRSLKTWWGKGTKWESQSYKTGDVYENNDMESKSGGTLWHQNCHIFTYSK